MSSPASSSAKTPVLGLLAGLVVLALLVVFAVVLPRTTDAGAGAEEPIGLPDTLPGGYTAADLEKAFTEQYDADQAETAAGQQASTRQHADEVLADVYDHAAETRVYASPDLTPVFVQAFRAPGGAFAPAVISPEGAAAAGGASRELVRVGDAVCEVESAAADPTGAAAPAGAPAYVSCQRSEGELTVQVTSGGVPTEEVVELVDATWDEIA